LKSQRLIDRLFGRKKERALERLIASGAAANKFPPR
jgi:hypothetical protein